MGADGQTHSPSLHLPWEISDLICKMETILILQSRHEELRRECKGPVHSKCLVDGMFGDMARDERPSGGQVLGEQRRPGVGEHLLSPLCLSHVSAARNALGLWEDKQPMRSRLLLWPGNLDS